MLPQDITPFNPVNTVAPPRRGTVLARAAALACTEREVCKESETRLDLAGECEDILGITNVRLIPKIYGYLDLYS